MGFFEDGKAKVSIHYNNLGLWGIVRKTPDKEMGWENPRYWSLNVTPGTLEYKLSRYPKYKEACMFVKQAHQDIVKFKDIEDIKTVAQGKIMTYKGKKFELSEPRLTHYNRLVSTYLMDGIVKVRLSYNGSYFMQSRYRTNEDIKPYWSHNYILDDVDKTKYVETFALLKEVHIKAYGEKPKPW